jgi:hypothetical protein
VALRAADQQNNCSGKNHGGGACWAQRISERFVSLWHGGRIARRNIGIAA